MKRGFCVLMAMLLMFSTLGALSENAGEKALTVMIYMCGSNLESLYGAANSDLMEIQLSGANTRQVNVVIMTGGARYWHNDQDASKLEINRLSGNQMINSYRGSTESMGKPETLQFFLDYVQSEFPARDYALILWDHGGGPMEGLCWDELHDPDHLTLDELTDALKASGFARHPLSWIGFDACLMASAEVALQLAPYARYMISSEETEPAYGWDYGFLRQVAQDSDGAATGRRIVENYVKADAEGPMTLSCVDLSRLEAVRSSVDALFGLWKDQVDEKTYSTIAKQRKAILGYGMDVGRDMRDHDLIDLGHLVATLTGDRQKLGAEVLSAVSDAVVCESSNLADSCGLSVYFPFYNKERYQKIYRDAYGALDMSDNYTRFIQSFGDILVGEPLIDWQDLPLGLYVAARENRSASAMLNIEGAANLLELAETPQDDVITDEDMQLIREGLLAKTVLTPEQQSAFTSARLMVMERTRNFLTDNYRYRLVYTSPLIEMDDDGAVRATWQDQTLHLVDVNGQSLVSEVSYSTLDNGEIAVNVVGRSAYQGGDDECQMVMTFALNDDGTIERRGIYVYDELTDSYSSRNAYDFERYPYIVFPDRYLFPRQGEGSEIVWEEEANFSRESVIRCQENWHLEFRTSSNARALGTLMEITDTQNTRHYTKMRVINTGADSRDLIREGIFARVLAEGMEIDASGIDINLMLIGSDWMTQNIYAYAPMVNGRESSFVTEVGEARYVAIPLEHGSSITSYLTLSATGVDEVREVSLRFSYICPMGIHASDLGGEDEMPLEMCTRVFSGPAKIIPDSAVPVNDAATVLTGAEISTVWGDNPLEPLNRPSLKGLSPVASGLEGEMTILGGIAQIPSEASGYRQAWFYAGRREGDRLYASRMGECVDGGDGNIYFMLPGKRVSLQTGGDAAPLCVAKDFGTGLAYSISPIVFTIGETTTNVIDEMMTFGRGNIRELSWNEGLYGVEFSQHAATYASTVPLTAGKYLDMEGGIEYVAEIGDIPLNLRCEDPSDEAMFVVFLDGQRRVMAASTVSPDQLTPLGDEAQWDSLRLEMDDTAVRVDRTMPTGEQVALYQYGDWLVQRVSSGARIVGYVGSETRVNVPDSFGYMTVTSIAYGAFDGHDIDSITIPAGVRYLDVGAFEDIVGQNAVVLRSVSNAVMIDIDTSIDLQGSAAAQRLYSEGTLTIEEPIKNMGFEAESALHGAISITTGTTIISEDSDSLEHYPNSELIRAVERWGFRHVRSGDMEILWVPPMMYWRTDGGDWTLMSCGGGYETVTVPSNVDGTPVTAIGSDAFHRNFYQYVTSVTVEEGIEVIGERAFAGSSVEEIVLPASLRSISADAFADCGMLRRVEIKCDPAILPDQLFASCPLLTSGRGTLILREDHDAARLIGSGIFISPDDLVGNWTSTALFDGNGKKWPGGSVNFSITLNANHTYSGYFTGGIQGRWFVEDGVVRTGDMVLIPDGSGQMTVYRNFWRIVCRS